MTAAISRLDACPTGCGNTELPRTALRAANGWLTAYHCTDCGQAWTQTWKDD